MTQDTQDSLKNFVKSHKDEFDTITPKDKIWEGIHKELEQSTRTNSKMIFWRAAAIILFVCSIGLTFYANRDSILKNTPSIAYDSEFLSTEKYYKKLFPDQDIVKEFPLKSLKMLSKLLEQMLPRNIFHIKLHLTTKQYLFRRTDMKSV